jgi:hypothetical protein
VANQWTEREGFWLPPGAWQAWVGEPELTPGEKIWVGVKVGELQGELADAVETVENPALAVVDGTAYVQPLVQPNDR